MFEPLSLHCPNFRLQHVTPCWSVIIRLTPKPRLETRGKNKTFFFFFAFRTTSRMSATFLSTSLRLLLRVDLPSSTPFPFGGSPWGIVLSTHFGWSFLRLLIAGARKRFILETNVLSNEWYYDDVMEQVERCAFLGISLLGDWALCEDARRSSLYEYWKPSC